MNKNDWQKAYEPAPPSFTGRMENTLQQLKEEEPVKKISFRVAAVALALLLALTGTAYAFTRLGVLDTYNGPTQPLPTAQSLVQQDFSQQGGETEYFTLTIREALSDGYRARYVYEYKAKSDNVFLVSDYSMLEDTALVGDKEMTLEEIHAQRPVFIDVGLPYPVDRAVEEDNIANGLAGMGNCVYEDLNTMVVWKEDSAPITDAILDYSCVYIPEGGERSEVNFSFRTLNAASVETVEIPELAGEQFEVRNVKLVFSPIYTYAFFEARLTGAKDMENTSYELTDAAGARIPLNQGSGSFPDDEGWETVTLAAAPMETPPDSLQILLHTYGPFAEVEKLPFEIK